MTFKNRLDQHLEAMASKDFETFINTVSKDTITLVMPNGNLITTYNDFSKLHKEWFSDNDWSLKYKVLNTVEKIDISTAFLSVLYTDVNEKNEPVTLTYYLNLIFEKIENEWFLIHDQNTVFTK